MKQLSILIGFGLIVLVGLFYWSISHTFFYNRLSSWSLTPDYAVHIHGDEVGSLPSGESQVPGRHKRLVFPASEIIFQHASTLSAAISSMENRQVTFSSDEKIKRCDKWAIVTVADALTFHKTHGRVISFVPTSWCLLVMQFNVSTDDSKLVTARLRDLRHFTVVFTKQLETAFARTRYYFRTRKIWRNYTHRKNLAYLFVMAHGAQHILEIDLSDCIYLDGISDSTREFLGQYSTHSRSIYKGLLPFDHIAPVDKSLNVTIFNPFEPLRASPYLAWPRGLALQQLSPLDHAKMYNKMTVPFHQIAAVQFYPDSNPDLDGIYTSLFKGDVTFESNLAANVIPSRGMFAPLNSKFTLHSSLMFFALFTPPSLEHKHNQYDIWRGYIAQYLLCSLGVVYKNIYKRLSAKRYLLTGNIQEDVSAEISTSKNMSRLIEFIRTFRFKWQPSLSRIEELWIGLYENGFASLGDVRLMQAWLLDLLWLNRGRGNHDLHNVGHEIPPVDKAHVSQQRKCNFSWPELDLFLTMAPKAMHHYRQYLLPTLLFFWPLERLSIVLVVDKELPNRDQFVEDRKRELRGAKSVKVGYHEPSEYQGKSGWMRQQLIMFYADNFTNSEYVGFIDTDTVFIATPDAEDLFIDGKPIFIGKYGLPGPMEGGLTGDWAVAPRMTQFALGMPEVMKSMSHFPLILRTKHLAALREYVRKLHKESSFSEVFRQMWRSDVYFSQFNIMCAYVYHFHHDDYSWRVQVLSGGWHGKAPIGKVKSLESAGIQPFEKEPIARICIHGDDHHDFKNRSIDDMMRLGYCHSAFRLVETSSRCKQYVPDDLAIFKDMYIFEYADWTWHPSVKTNYFARRLRQESHRCHANWNLKELRRLRLL